MPRSLDDRVDRGGFFKALGQLMAGYMADQVSEAVAGMGPKLLRPPGALEEFDFLVACTRCDKCIEACPQDTLLKAPPSAGLAASTPHFDPRAMPCFLCTDLPCVKACPDGALLWPQIERQGKEPLEGPKAARMGLARVLERRCLTYERDDRPAMACRTCVDRCPYPDEAIRLVAPDAEAAVAHPEVDPDHCTGCGLCTFACPTLEPAIVVKPRG